jgi:hypothetical protein
MLFSLISLLCARFLKKVLHLLPIGAWARVSGVATRAMGGTFLRKHPRRKGQAGSMRRDVALERSLETLGASDPWGEDVPFDGCVRKPGRVT